MKWVFFEKNVFPQKLQKLETTSKNLNFLDFFKKPTSFMFWEFKFWFSTKKDEEIVGSNF